MSESKIEWCDRSDWNPIRGCTRVSEGCRRCYAETMAARFSGPGRPFEGYAKRVGGEARWTGKVSLRPERLDAPLRWKKPARIFACSMSDLFHESLSDEEIAAVFGVMAACPKHVFQVLTKRPERARRWFELVTHAAEGSVVRCIAHSVSRLRRALATPAGMTWPLPNVWLGVSVEDQATADERIPLLLQTPAAVRWVSYEPALGPVDFRRSWCDYLDGWTTEAECCGRPDRGGCCGSPEPVQVQTERLDWIVVGGESGPARRQMNLAWLESVDEQTRAAGVPLFVKQDSAPRPGAQGRIPDRLWARKEFPA